MVDFAESRAAILILWKVPVVLDGKGANVFPARLDIRDWIVVVVIEHVAGVIADLYAGITDFGHDTGAMCSCGRITAMLLDDESDLRGARDGCQLFQVPNPR